MASPQPAPALALPAAGAALALAAFWFALQLSLRDKSPAYDETVHAAAGWAYWRLGDYRLNPENGNLPQRVAGLGLAAAAPRFPPADSAAWRAGREWDVADAFFHREGNDPAALLARGRAACGLIAVALAGAVWGLSRRLWGEAGGMVSLLLCVLSPCVLANGSLIASDACAALFFLLACAALWAACRRLSPGRVAVAGAALGGLFLSKMSAFLILPLGAGLGAARLLWSRPLPVELGGRRRAPASRPRVSAVLALGGLAAIAVAIAVVWMGYGFRYAAFAGPAGRFDPSWEEVLGPAPRGATALIAAARRRELLPEGFLYGAAYALHFSRWRDSFWNGAHSLRGRPGFFPYVIAVKTPWPVFGAVALAAAAAVLRWRVRASGGERLRRLASDAAWTALPFGALAAGDLAAAMAGPLNLGQRHVLPFYAALFVLCGAAAPRRGDGPALRRTLAAGSAGLLILLGVETARWFPDYLAYFNPLVPAGQGYRHLVDSSLDWGQDLPGVREYIGAHPERAPFRLAYFGSGDPAAWGVRADLVHLASPAEPPAGALPVMTRDFPPAGFAAGLDGFLREHPEYELAGTADVDATGARRAILLKRPAALRLRPGAYLVSATVLQQMEYNPKAPWGPWNARFEARYRELRRETEPLRDDDPAARREALGRGSIEDWRRLLDDLGEFDALRFARLAAALRARAPDDEIHGSVLVYQVGPAELDRALDGPPPELGRDLPAELEAGGLNPR